MKYEPKTLNEVTSESLEAWAQFIKCCPELNNGDIEFYKRIWQSAYLSATLSSQQRELELMKDV